MDTESKSYSTKEVAQIFETSEDNIRRLYRSGELGNKENGYRSKKDGISFSDKEIRQYLESHPDSKYGISVNNKIRTGTAIAIAIASGATAAITPLFGITQGVGLIAAALIAASDKKKTQAKNIREQLKDAISSRERYIEEKESEIAEIQRKIEELRSTIVELKFLLDHMDAPALDTEIVCSLPRDISKTHPAQPQIEK